MSNSLIVTKIVHIFIIPYKIETTPTTTIATSTTTATSTPTTGNSLNLVSLSKKDR